MDINEALQFADEWTKGHTFYEGLQGWRVVCAVLAAEVRRFQAPAVEAVPVAHMRVMVGCRAPDDCEEYLDVCKPDDVGIDGKAFPVYMEPPALDDKKHQRLLSENARLSILNHLYNQIADGRTEFSAMDMDYWDSSHDKLLEAMQNKLDDDTRKLVLELCRLTEEMTLPHSKLLRKRTIAKEIMKKLVAGDE